MNLSIIIPLLNEQESLPELHQWIVKVMTTHNYSYEVIFIDDGSTDESWQIIEQLSKENTNVKGIRFLTNFGKSQALHAGFAKAKGDVIITMDADLQDSPEEIPDLFNMITNQNYDLVSGWKKKRYDSVIGKNLPSKLFNWAARKTSGVKLNDFNCGLKAYKNIVVNGQTTLVATGSDSLEMRGTNGINITTTTIDVNSNGVNKELTISGFALSSSINDLNAKQFPSSSDGVPYYNSTSTPSVLAPPSTSRDSYVLGWKNNQLTWVVVATAVSFTAASFAEIVLEGTSTNYTETIYIDSGTIS